MHNSELRGDNDRTMESVLDQKARGLNKSSSPLLPISINFSCDQLSFLVTAEEEYDGEEEGFDVEIEDDQLVGNDDKGTDEDPSSIKTSPVTRESSYHQFCNQQSSRHEATRTPPVQCYTTLSLLASPVSCRTFSQSSYDKSCQRQPTY
ncbi:hypothetical protein MHU86_19510 [Fragilaria crotonensis]|nr:hypothetical protein MHU86_19510 [Fragilaria crotonensis]